MEPKDGNKNKKTEIFRNDDMFVSSVENLKKDDIAPLCEKKEKKSGKRIGDVILSVAGVLCAAALIVCGVLIARNLIDKKRGNDIYSEAASGVNPVTIGNNRSGEDEGDPVVMGVYDRIKAYVGGEDLDTAEDIYDLDLSSMKASISSLKERNSDVIGWIYAENTRINYPLMRSSAGNDDYYLTHTYTGEYRAVGSIYMVSDCSPKLNDNFNTLIYGHNVVNGTMFHDVYEFYRDEDFFKNNLIYIYTLDGAYIYKPFAVYETTSDYNYIQTSFYDESEFLAFVKNVASNSVWNSGVSITSGDTIITLSTCTNGGVQGTGRYALHAKLMAFTE